VFIVCLALAGVVLLVLGLVFSVGGVFAKLVKDNVNEKVQLKPGGLVYKEWVKASIPIYMQCFVFNLTNPDEVLAGLEIPSMTQIGPYSYRELRSNEVANWTSDKSIVTFMPNRTYIFDPETSCDGCDDINDSFVTVNIPLLASALKLKNSDLTDYSGCLSLLQNVLDGYQIELFHSKSVHEILWGYTDLLLKTIVHTRDIAHCPAMVSEGVKPFVQLQYNNSHYGISAVNTGQVDISKLKQFTMWRGKTHLTWWSDKYANMINGTDGTQFSPTVSKDDPLQIFIPDICRSGYITYESTVTIKDIDLYRFIIPNELYLSGDVHEPNKGFCVSPGCLPTGLLNISVCQPMNHPVVVSPPHFYQGNKSLLKTVSGLDPVKSAHETYLDVEPITGIVMRAAKRFQINVALESVDILKQTTGNFKPVFLPVMFVNESALISDEKAKEFRDKVYGVIKLTKVIQYILIGLGAFCILVAIVLAIVLFCARGRVRESDTSEEEKPLCPKVVKSETTIFLKKPLAERGQYATHEVHFT